LTKFPHNEIECRQVRQEVSGYVDGETPASLRALMDRHFSVCASCKAVLDGIRNVVRLVGSDQAFDLPEAVSKRLYSKLEEHIASQSPSEPRTIPVGITPDRVPLGSHLIYFWDGDEEFERGVRFLYPGLGKGEHCILFGHDEALERALDVLRKDGFDPDALIRNLDLSIIHRRLKAEETVSEIAAVLEGAMRAGASAVRFLGNLGMGKDPLPGGEDDVHELEQKVDSLISALPCVVVCMYDVRTVSGRLILRGGLETHPLMACAAGVQDNPFHIPHQDLSHSRHIH